MLNPKDGGYDKCSDTGSGIFGFRRRKNKKGKIITDNENDCGGDKSCRKSYIFKYLVTIICPPSALFLQGAKLVGFTLLYRYIHELQSITSWSYLRITSCYEFYIKKINYNNRNGIRISL